jgi:TPR repeat protein
MKRATTSILSILLLCLTVSSAMAQKPLSYRDGYIELDQGNFHNAFFTFKRLAEQSGARSQHELGFMYLVGFESKQDFKAAAEWFRRTAEQGLARAQFNLGKLYETGRGVSKSNVNALQWFWITA